MPIFGRSRQERPTQEPTTAELRDERARQWALCFAGPSAEADYRRAFLRYSPVFWDIVQSAQHDLLRLLVDRVPSEIGVPAIFGLSVIFADHPKAEEATRATLAMIVNELMPVHARTLLIVLADAWENAAKSPYDLRGDRISQELTQTLQRLEVTAANANGVISSIAVLIDRGGMDTREE